MVYRILKCLPILAVLIASIAFTRYNYFADTAGYVEDIVRVIDGPTTTHENHLWESGHLLLRPLGVVLFHLAVTFGLHPLATDPRVTICWCLIGSSIAAGFITIFLFLSLAEHFLHSFWAANFLATAFLCFYAFLNYLQTGTSYLIGLMWITVAVWLAIRAAESKRGLVTSVLAGLAAAVAALFWLPYLCALPGVLAVIGLWRPDPVRKRIQLVFISAVCAILLLSTVYLAAIAELRMYSLSQIGQWLVDAGHGQSQNRRLLRVWTGLPRSFLWLGNEGMLLKRYLLHDPYARTTPLQLLREGGWRLIAFYGFLLALVWGLVRSEGGNKILLMLGFAATPVLFFALVIFEPGSPERYLPLFPFLAVAVAFSLARAPGSVPRLVIVVFMTIVIVADVKYLWRASLNAASKRSEERARSLQSRVGANGVVAVVTLMDELYSFAGSLQLDPRNPVRIKLPVYNVIEIGNNSVQTWRRDFASRSLRAFAAGDTVWVSKRFLAERPIPEWGWTEGDDARISWKDLRPFFTRFVYSDEIGGGDGFVRLIDSTHNREVLSANLNEGVN